MNNELSVLIYIEDNKENSIGMIDGHINDIDISTIDEGYDHEWGYRSILVDIITTSEEEIVDEIMKMIEFEDGVNVTDEMIKNIKNHLDKKINVDDINLYDGIQFNIVI